MPARLVLSLVALVLGAGVLAGCGASPTDTPAGGGSAGGAFPVTVTHEYGSTVVPAPPKRVVSLGFTDQDALLALGIVPVAIREFTGNQPSATWPWARARLGGAQPQVLPLGEVGVESLAALKPDLIVAISAGLTREQFELYSKIAPTIAAPAGFVDYGTPWPDATRLTGQAVGKAAEAENLVTGLERRITETKARYPQLSGRTVAGVLPSTDAAGGYFVFGPQSLRSRFFAGLGMRGVPAFDQAAGDKFYGQFSSEQIGSLDQADVVVLSAAEGQGRARFEAQPGWQALEAVRQKRVLALGPEQEAALSFSSVLSIPTALDSVVPQLARTVR